MAWDWIEKSTRRIQALGSEYKQNHALVQRLLALHPDAARDELTRVWLAMDERGRAAMKMTLAGLALSQQAAPSSAESKARLERLKALHLVVEQASTGAPPAAAPASAEATLTSGAARVTNKLADVAERARPKAGQLIESARKGIEQHGPAMETAVRSVISELLKADAPAKAGRPASEPAAPPREPGMPPPIPEDPAHQPAPAAGSTAIHGQWTGTLRRPGGDEIGCDLQVAASGRPVWAFHDTNGFKQKELTQEGQRFQYVPPGGGVATVQVQSVTGSGNETGYVIDYSFEGSSNGYLTQKYQRLALTGRLRGSRLDVTYAEAGVSSFGDKTGLAATEDATEYRGSLIKQS